MTIISKRKTHITMAVLFVFLTFLDQLTKKIASMYLIGNDITIIPNILELHYLENKGANKLDPIKEFWKSSRVECPCIMTFFPRRLAACKSNKLRGP